MSRPRSPTRRTTRRPGGDEIRAYSNGQANPFGTMCNTLRKLIDTAMPKAQSKVWHGAPVWFLDENPVVGYSVSAKRVSLLFWNGKAMDEPELKPVGKYGAAQTVFHTPEDIDPVSIRRWLKKARSNVFDSKAFFKEMREKKRA